MQTSKLNMKNITIIILHCVFFFLTLTMLNAQDKLIINLPADSIKKLTGKDTAEILAIIQNDSIVKIIVTIDERPKAIDADGNSYSVVKIGEQWWMAENLSTKKFNDGTSIPLIENYYQWSSIRTPAFCRLNNNEGYGQRYDVLYNWYAVETGKLCPAGWHVPSDEEWKQLEFSIGMNDSLVDSAGYRGNNEALKLKKDPYAWLDTKLEDITNEYGFSALPIGVRSGDNGRFYGFYSILGTEWWTSTEWKNRAWMRGFVSPGNNIRRYPENKKDGRSVRCVKD